MIRTVHATPMTLAVGERTTLTATARDADGDPLAYAWTKASDCAGVYENARSPNTTFQLAAPLAEAEVCVLTLTVTDGRGGTRSIRVTIATPIPVAPTPPPTFDTTFQSTTTVADGGSAVLRVRAHDAKRNPLRFDWSTTSGVLGPSDDAGPESTVTWTAPTPCVSAVIDARAASPDGTTSTQSFRMSCEAALGPLRLLLPPSLHAVAGTPISVHNDNIVLTQNIGNYRFTWSSDIGVALADRWTLTPTDADAGDHALTLTITDGAGAVVTQRSTLVHVEPRAAKDTRLVRLLLVGDSLTQQTYYPNELARLLSQPGGPTWRMCGTQRAAYASPGVMHEGYAGWMWNDFVSLSGLDETASRSPFVYNNLAGAAQLDIGRYIADHCDDTPPDLAIFLLGINDVFNAATSASDTAFIDERIQASLLRADRLLAAFHAGAPSAILAVGLPIPPNARDGAFIETYGGRPTRWEWKQVQHRLVQRMIERFRDRETEGIRIVPTHVYLDSLSGFTPTNALHPSPAGYAAIGAGFHAWVRAWDRGQ